MYYRSLIVGENWIINGSIFGEGGKCEFYPEISGAKIL